MSIVTGLLIIALGAFCQSSSYVPIRRVKGWSWESFWLVQGVFAWVALPLLGALLAVPEGRHLAELFATAPGTAGVTFLYGALWGVGGLTFGLSMRYLGVALGQSLALGTCAGLGTILAPLLTGRAADLTSAVLWGVAATLAGIAVIGVAGGMRSAAQGDGEKRGAAGEFNFPKGVAVALLAGLMSGCFNIGLAAGEALAFPGSSPLFATLPATLLVTLGGFATNAAYCLWQNARNRTWGDYRRGGVWANNLLFCLLAGALWYSQFFGLSLGKGFLEGSPALTTFAFCILMSLNVVFSNVWGVILREWRGCPRRAIAVLCVGLAVLIASSFLPQLL